MRRNSKSEIEFLLRRLDEVRISERERIRAKAHLQRAEAVADFLAAAAGAIGRFGLRVRRVLLPEARFRPTPRRQTSPWVG